VTDSELLDGVQDLSLLSDRQLLERLVRTTEKIEERMTVDEDYLKAAFNSLDVQWTDLQTRLAAQATQLQQALADETEYQSLKTTVNAIADKMQADAVAMSNTAQPSAVADPSNPATAATVPADPSTPIQADSGAASASAPAGDNSASTSESPAPDSGAAPFTS
jgi:hypothetical protein